MQAYLEAGGHVPWSVRDSLVRAARWGRSVLQNADRSDDCAPEHGSHPRPTAVEQQSTELQTQHEHRTDIRPKQPATLGTLQSEQASRTPRVAGPLTTQTAIQQMIRKEAVGMQIPPELPLAVAYVESGLNPRAHARTSSALGLFQFIRSTRRRYGVYDDRRFLENPALQIRLGVRHLAHLYRQFDGSLVKVLLAYHLGEGAVARREASRAGITYVYRVLCVMKRIGGETQVAATIGCKGAA